MPEICDRLREVREALGLSQQALAERCGITARSQRNYESGERLPDAAYLAAIAAAGADVLYILTGQRAGEEHGPATVALGSLIAAIVFVPIGMAQATESIWQWSVMPIGLAVAILSTALPYSLEMIALTRLPTRIFGTLMSMEPALAAISGMVFLGETLTLTQTLALCSIIAASMGSTLTMRPEPKVEKVDIN